MLWLSCLCSVVVLEQRCGLVSRHSKLFGASNFLSPHFQIWRWPILDSPFPITYPILRIGPKTRDHPNKEIREIHG